LHVVSNVEEIESDGEATVRVPVAVDIPRITTHLDADTPSQPNIQEPQSSYATANTENIANTSSSVTSTPLATPRANDYMNSRPTDTFRRRQTSGTSFFTASDGISTSAEESDATPTFQSGAEVVATNDRLSPGQERGSASFETTTPTTPRPTASDTWLLESPQRRQNDQDNNHQSTSGHVKFHTPENPVLKKEFQMRAKMAQGIRKSRLPRRFTRGKLKDGEIVKVEKMLVRLDITTGSEQPREDYDEKDSQRVETRTTEQWREFMVVCRESHQENAVLCLQMYQTRVCFNPLHRTTFQH
jgi:phage-related tail fiber protein